MVDEVVEPDVDDVCVTDGIGRITVITTTVGGRGQVHGDREITAGAVATTIGGHAMHRGDRSRPERAAGGRCEGHRHVGATIGHGGGAVIDRNGGARREHNIGRALERRRIGIHHRHGLVAEISQAAAIGDQPGPCHRIGTRSEIVRHIIAKGDDRDVAAAERGDVGRVKDQHAGTGDGFVWNATDDRRFVCHGDGLMAEIGIAAAVGDLPGPRRGV